MSTGLIIAIVVIALLILAALLFVLPRMRRKAEERKAVQRMEQRRTQAVEQHRSEAEEKAYRAEMAEQEARQARAEAELHESRASMHERGMADDDLPDAGDPRFERDREIVADRDGDGRPDAARSPASSDDAAAVETTRYADEQPTQFEREQR